MGEEWEKRLDEVCAVIKSEGKITQKSHSLLSLMFGNKYKKATKTISDRRVRKYLFRPSGREIWTVVGNKGEYQVIPSVGFCACADFYYRLKDGAVHLCYHLLAQRLAEALDAFETVRVSDEDKIQWGGEITHKGFSQ